MIATFNCPGWEGSRPPARARQGWSKYGMSVVLACFLAVFLREIPVRADQSAGPEENPRSFAARARQRFAENQLQYRAQPENLDLAIKFGQAAFDWAEFATNSQQREEISRAGIEACRSVILRQPKSAAGHYYLAMNLGQLARTKSLGALKLVTEMETEFQITRDLDENFDYAGPDRNLGLLYSEAPGWPTSIGSRSSARHHLHRAVVLQPNYPENRLNLFEACLKWGDKSGASHEFHALKELWPNAKNEFPQKQWEESWADWNRRWEKIQIRFQTDPVLESPRQRK